MNQTTHNEKTAQQLLSLLKLSLQDQQDFHQEESISLEGYEAIFDLAEKHEVLVLLDNILNYDLLSPDLQNRLFKKTAQTVQKGIKLQVMNTQITNLLVSENINAITLKGYSIARFYPIPEYRKSTDIDLLLLDKDQLTHAEQLLYSNGFTRSNDQFGNHHIVMTSNEGETLELHTSLAIDFKDDHLNEYLAWMHNQSRKHCYHYKDEEHSIIVYDTAWQGFYLMVHMIQHFVGSGFGLRNLCDWVVLWQNCEEESAREEFWQMAQDSGTTQFARTITAICVYDLGLDQRKSPVQQEELASRTQADELLEDILNAGEFGYSESDRMVGMQGNSIRAYVREFHYQMHTNFPKAGRYFILWPVLWMATGIRFLSNNRKLNRPPLRQIMKKAGERGKLVDQFMPKKK